ncbi:MAG: glycosyl hydrolase family 18 protein, partial [bacterium]
MHPLGLVLALAKPTLSAWLVPWNPESLVSFQKHAEQLTDVMPEFLFVDKTGTIQKRGTWSERDWATVRRIASEHHVNVYLMLSNYLQDGFNSDAVSEMLKADKSEKAIKRLAEVVSQEGVTGIDLDLESLHPSDRDQFSEFCSRLRKKLGRGLSITVHPKTEEPGNWDGPKAQDWKALGRAADVFRVMCYDFSWSGSPAGP